MNRFFQALIALSGLLITGLLGYQTATNTERQTELAQAQSRYALIALFSDQVNAAFERCDLDPILVATDAANELAEVHDLPQYGDYLASALTKVQAEVALCAPVTVEAPPAASSSDAATPGAQPAPVTPDLGGVSAPAAPEPEPQPQQQVALEASPVRNLELRQQEGYKKQASSNAPAPGVGAQAWYAVLASYKAGLEEGYLPDDLAQMRAVIAKGDVGSAKLEVFRTSVSDYYVIVLSSEGRGRDAARELAAAARSLGLSKEAFVQDDRNWTRCDTPDSVAGLRSCSRVAPPSKR